MREIITTTEAPDNRKPFFARKPTGHIVWLSDMLADNHLWFADLPANIGMTPSAAEKETLIDRWKHSMGYSPQELTIGSVPEDTNFENGPYHVRRVGLLARQLTVEMRVGRPTK